MIRKSWKRSEDSVTWVLPGRAEADSHLRPEKNGKGGDAVQQDFPVCQ